MNTERSDSESSLEWWIFCAIAIATAFLSAWGLVFVKWGIVSVYAYATAIPVLGLLSVPVGFWGCAKSIFNPPVFRWPRFLALATMLVVGYLGTQHVMAVPLSTEGWSSSKTYRLPFGQEWYVLAGGDEWKSNYHAVTPALRWGYDFTRLENGRRYADSSEHLEDYYCFGEPVLAPVSGQVVEVGRGQPDHPPGQLEGSSPLGNHVVIRAAPKEYLFMAHLRQGSIEVEKGQSVDAGDEIGECGNSGRALKPHLHVHLQRSRDFPIALGLPLRFSNYVADGQRVKRGMPRGESSPKARDGMTVRPVGTE